VDIFIKQGLQKRPRNRAEGKRIMYLTNSQVLLG